MERAAIAIWRRRLATVTVALGLLFLLIAGFLYFRYASDPLNLHVQERVRHARTLGLLWTVSFYGPALLFVVSLFGAGWRRWAALALSAVAIGYGLATLGALCGPFNC